ncbi:MAG TPA: hypothetical protein VIW46_06000 [Acidimicrobiia bacterium]|jgi:hypothetical protein
MENFATRFADLLESTAIKARALTVDRASNAIRIVTLVFPTIVFALLAIIFLFMTIHKALAIPLGSAAAFAIIAGLFAIGGVFLWSKRDPQDET